MRKWISTVREIGKWVGYVLLAVLVIIFLLECLGINLMPFACWYVSLWISLFLAFGFPMFLPLHRGYDADRQD